MKKDFGGVIDIDGVLLKDSIPIEDSVETLKKLDELNIPHILVTNHGGVTEIAQAKLYSKALNHTISPDRLILSHTPLVYNSYLF